MENYSISVGEPWDFKGIDGPNIIYGTVVEKLNDQCLIFQSNHYLQFGNINGKLLMLSPRYHDSDFSSLANSLIVINGSILLKDYSKDWTEEDFQNNSKFVIIGSINKRPCK